MRMLIVIRVLIAAAAGGLSLFAVGAQADERVCRGNLGAEQIDGNLHVVAACVLSGTRIDGNLTVGSKGRLSADAVRVGGNIQADGAAAVVVGSGARVGGNIQITGSGNIRISGSIVDGDVQLFGNHGAISVRDNRIAGNLQCKSNRGRISGSKNQVGGNKEDQCASL